jgi:hypothetical protein
MPFTLKPKLDNSLLALLLSIAFDWVRFELWSAWRFCTRQATHRFEGEPGM